MNDYELLNQILNNLIVEGKEVPVEYIEYTGRSKTYVTYTFTNDEPTLFGDDKEIGSIVSVDIDIFSNKNYLAIENKIIEIINQ